MSNENWKAKCDSPGRILMRPHGGGCEHWFDIQCAEQLRDQLTAAIEGAKRQSDMMNTVAILLTQDELERLISALQTKHGEPPSQRDWSLKFADRLKRLREAFTKEGK